MDHIYDLPSWFRSGLSSEAWLFSRFESSIASGTISFAWSWREENSQLVLESRWSRRRKEDDDEFVRYRRRRRQIFIIFIIFGRSTPVRLHRRDGRRSIETLQLPRRPRVRLFGQEGVFCGHGKEENHDFDASVQGALSHYQYYCFTEPWSLKRATVGRRPNEPYEPQVVKRHCGEMDTSMRRQRKVHFGVIEHINKKEEQNLKCVQFGFGVPTALETVAKGPMCARESFFLVVMRVDN